MSISVNKETYQKQLYFLVNHFQLYFSALEVMCTEPVDIQNNYLKAWCFDYGKEPFEDFINNPLFAKLKKELPKLISEEALNECEDSNVLWNNYKDNYIDFSKKLEELSTSSGANNIVLLENDSNYIDFKLIKLQIEKIKKSAQRNKMKLINGQVSKQVVFNKNNGDLIVYGEKIVNVRPGSKGFFLIQILRENFETPVSYDDLANKIIIRLKEKKKSPKFKGPLIAYDFCQKCKTRIKQKIAKKINSKIKAKELQDKFDAVIIDSSTSSNAKGYMMTTPVGY